MKGSTESKQRVKRRREGLEGGQTSFSPKVPPTPYRTPRRGGCAYRNSKCCEIIVESGEVQEVDDITRNQPPERSPSLTKSLLTLALICS